MKTWLVNTEIERTYKIDAGVIALAFVWMDWRKQWYVSVNSLFSDWDINPRPPKTRSRCGTYLTATFGELWYRYVFGKQMFLKFEFINGWFRKVDLRISTLTRWYPFTNNDSHMWSWFWHWSPSTYYSPTKRRQGDCERPPVCTIQAENIGKIFSGLLRLPSVHWSPLFS